MGSLGIPIDVRVDVFERKKIREAQISEKFKKICFSDMRRIKALASTGYWSEGDAALWLLSHLDDPLLDEPFYREFYLFLCVRSDLAQNISDFWLASSGSEGWNYAHEFPPHITLLSNLRVSDDKVLLLHGIYDKIIQEHSHLLKFNEVPLKLVTSDDFIGYIVSSDKVNASLERLCRVFLQELLNAGIISDDDPMRRCKSNYHMSLAYGFQLANRSNLGDLQDSYNMKSQLLVSWTLDLFSGDPRLSTPDSELYEMRTTVEVDDVLFSNLSLEDNPQTDISPPQLTPSSPEMGQMIVGCHLSSSASSVGAGRTPDSDSLQPSIHTPFNEVPALADCPHPPNTLAHSAGDKVLFVGSCNLNGRYGVPVGVNLTSGLTGVFSLASARRIPKWHAWVTHRSTVVIGCQEDSLKAELCNTFVAPSRIPASFSAPADFCEPLAVLDNETRTSSLAVGVNVGSSSSGFCSKLLPRSCRRKSASLNSSSPSSSPSAFQTSVAVGSKSGVKTPPPTATGSSSIFGSRFFGSLLSGASNGSGSLQQQTQKPQRRLFVMRHAERVDICFGRAWTTRCIDRRGLYRRLNLNMPPRLPVREDIIDHTLDSPLTQVGLFVAGACGRAFAEAGVRFSVCYVSPALRCVQTACQLLRAAGQCNLAVRIEPFLFEWLGWYSGKLPNFLSPAMLTELGYNVDREYQALSSLNQLDLHESVPQFYARSTQIVKDILEQNPIKGANILMVGHAASLDACTRSLLRKRFRSGGSGSGSSSNNGNVVALTNGNSSNNNSGGGGMNDIEELHRRCSPVPYCGLLCAVEGGRRWRLDEPPIPPLTHGQNADFDWRQSYSSSICSLGIR
ncbi:phosphoglycerate mutase [Echinococcus multilocularis]|uniref:Phosphoglycerate mutase n=1 Tax=Echinococcus multilocularis TaxID=6211 RepID=A0A068YAF3_ECHMU|nr:phosphoglycerate mutase [Echinococcus multilocularis]